MVFAQRDFETGHGNEDDKTRRFMGFIDIRESRWEPRRLSALSMLHFRIDPDRHPARHGRKNILHKCSSSPQFNADQQGC